MLRVLDLFSGIGGFSLGLERTGGFRTVAFCEIEPYARAVLKKHWPEVPCFEDIRKLYGLQCGPVDVICGGFPCQDISAAGAGTGLAGARSGLWSEYRRLIEEILPLYAIIENVSVLRSRGLDQILRELAAFGYDAEWYCIPASAVGAPHQRDRIWIVAYPKIGKGVDVPGIRGTLERQEGGGIIGNGGMALANPHQPRLEGWLRRILQERAGELSAGEGDTRRDAWLPEPDVGRVANGVPSRVDRLRALGNAVVPQIPEIIGRAILEAEGLSAP